LLATVIEIKKGENAEKEESAKSREKKACKKDMQTILSSQIERLKGKSFD